MLAREANDESAGRVQGARILVVEDDEEIRAAAQDALSDLGYDACAEATAEGALSLMARQLPAAVVADVRMPGMDGIEFCRRLTGDWPHVPVVLMTAFGDVDTAVEALRAGAFDFITKPISFEHLASTLERAVQQRAPGPKIVRLEDPDVPAASFEGLVGQSSAVAALVERITRVAVSLAPVLITGERGTGKGLVAHALHRCSARRNGPFVVVACTSCPAERLDADLFAPPASSSSGSSRPNAWQRAEGGTLFLDEVAHLPLELQSKLLGLLEERRTRLADAAPESGCDVRLLAASTSDLEHAARAGQFREDLLLRLNVHHVHVPLLRERIDDLSDLARHFLSRAAAGGRPARLSEDAERLLSAHQWPGNVAELEACLNVAASRRAGDVIRACDLPLQLQGDGAAPTSQPPVEPASLEEVERRHIEVVLRATGWNKALAARKLGIDRATLYRKLMRLGLMEPRR